MNTCLARTPCVRTARLGLRRLLLILTVFFVQAQSAWAEDPAPGTPIALGDAAQRLKVFVDGKGHYIALEPFADDQWRNVFWSPDGKRFVELTITGGGSSGKEQFDKLFWEPRVDARYQAALGMNDGKYWVQCRDQKTSLTMLADDEAKKLMEKAQFVTATWDRSAYALVRDLTGTYWYVDRGKGDKARNFRVFMGQRGALKSMPLVNVVSDSEGDIFATKQGTLRLVLSKPESLWVHGKKEAKLTVLQPIDNRKLIYTELGVYLGQRLGTPCDDL